MSAGTLAKRTICGRTFTASNRTAAHLTSTLTRLERRHPGARLVIIQTCYNTTIAASAGTHDYDGVFDVRIEGLTWWAAQRFLRSCGWAAWYRHTGTWADERAWHIHMASIPEGLPANPTIEQIDGAYARAGIQVGIYVPGQIDDYYAHALGLAGQHRAGSDHSWFPDSINATVFRYQEDDMPFNDWPQADKDALAAAVWQAQDQDGHHRGATLYGCYKLLVRIAKKLGA